MDTCLPGTGCQPAVYSFQFCTGIACPAGSDQSPTDIQAHLPVGKKIRVEWQLFAAGGFAPGAAYLAVHDEDDGATYNTLLLGGAGGMGVLYSEKYAPTNMPFDFTLQKQNCGRNGADADFQFGDDYTMIVRRTDGLGQPLALATGEVGSLEYALPSGSTASVRIHCLSAVQPGATDDYWNWDFWLERDPTMSDGGAQ